MSDPKPSNRLANETSQYLRQHAENPVDWYPWGEEAFNAARRADKPIFLSIGYSTCHWCHVMESEVFEDPETAKKMNELFINIKVDREEMPEIDAFYMDCAQSMLAGAAGWPLNVVLTPDLYPFMAMTYIPLTGRPGTPGMDEVMQRVRSMWSEDERPKSIEHARQIVETVRASQDLPLTKVPARDFLGQATEMFYQLIDPVYGGMQGSPKFPLSFQLETLLRDWAVSHDARSLFCVQKTLDYMSRGGLHDHVGGGFSRYSVDQAWRVPHFEKMLYDNAQLAQIYTRGWKVTHDEIYRTTARDILVYLHNEMRGPDGGFCAAQDADSEGVEGKYYTWTPEEIVSVLGRADGLHFCELCGITAEGQVNGRSVVTLPSTLPDFAAKRGIDRDELLERWKLWRSSLQEARGLRVPPVRDEKIVTAWNGLAIGAFALGGAAFQESSMLEIAREAALFVRAKLWRDGRLLHCYQEGSATLPANLDDYAFLIQGLIQLYSASGDSEWLLWALQLTERVKEDFSRDHGAFFHTDGQDPHLLVRRSLHTDGSEPSGNGVHAENLMSLYQLTWNESYRMQAEGIFRGVDTLLEAYPIGFCHHLLGLQRYYNDDLRTIVVALNAEHALKEEIRSAFHRNYHPNTLLLWRDEADTLLHEAMPFLKVQGPVNNETSLYVCREGACEAPLTGREEILNFLQEI